MLSCEAVSHIRPLLHTLSAAELAISLLALRQGGCRCFMCLAKLTSIRRQRFLVAQTSLLTL